MAKIEVTPKTIQQLISDVEDGCVKIPRFQREFVWNMNASAKLLDSIIKGYPIGSLIYWKTKEVLRSIRDIGGFKFPDVPSDDYIYYVLDGQQRLTSLIACLKGETIDKDDFKNIKVNLNALENEPIVIVDTNDLKEPNYISLCDLYSKDFLDFIDIYPKDKLQKIQDYRNSIQNYQISRIDLTKAELDVATEIFTRINVNGKPLTVFEIMCAKMYDEKANFDLYEKRELQINEWETVGFESIPDTVVLQAISLCLVNSCKGSDILSLDKKTFINAWDNVCEAFNKAIDYLRTEFKIPVSKLMPYDALIIPFVYFFYKNKKRPFGDQKTFLQDYFWRNVYTSRFADGVEAKLSHDAKNVIDLIIKNKEPETLVGVDISTGFIMNNGEFTLSSAYVKGILCILCSKRPVSFLDGHEVTIDNAWLNQGNSKNYHHFFPKAYMKKNQPKIDEKTVNHIGNITIVDGWLNKSVIKDKAPSKYMSDFLKQEPKLAKNMTPHLITDLQKFGIWDDDYEVFLTMRIKEIQKEMKKRIIFNDKLDKTK